MGSAVATIVATIAGTTVAIVAEGAFAASRMVARGISRRWCHRGCAVVPKSLDWAGIARRARSSLSAHEELMELRNTPSAPAAVVGYWLRVRLPNDSLHVAQPSPAGVAQSHKAGNAVGNPPMRGLRTAV